MSANTRILQHFLFKIFPIYDLGIKISPFPKLELNLLPLRPLNYRQRREQDAEVAKTTQIKDKLEFDKILLIYYIFFSIIMI